MDVMFNMHKIKYTDMDKLLGAPVKSEHQIFINLETVLRKLISSNVEDYIKTTDKNLRIREFISNLLNLVAHYRKYFTNKGVKSTVYVYISSPDAKFANASVIEDYRKNTSHIYDTKTVFGKFLRDLLEPIQLFFNYIEGVYFLHTSVIEPSLIPKIMAKPNTRKILITTDRYEYQYVNENFTILRPKAKGMSYVLTEHNAIQRMKLEDGVGNDKEISASFIPLVLAFTGDMRRTIPKFTGIGLGKITTLLHDGVEKGLLTDKTTNVSLLEDMIDESIKEQVKKNFMVVDLNTQYNMVAESTKIILNEFIVDRYDEVSLKKLNDIFAEQPIMIEELQPLKDKKKSVFER